VPRAKTKSCPCAVLSHSPFDRLRVTSPTFYESIRVKDWFFKWNAQAISSLLLIPSCIQKQIEAATRNRDSILSKINSETVGAGLAPALYDEASESIVRLTKAGENQGQPQGLPLRVIGYLKIIFLALSRLNTGIIRININIVGLSIPLLKGETWPRQSSERIRTERNA
jgi:hypothetical protein